MKNKSEALLAVAMAGIIAGFSAQKVMAEDAPAATGDKAAAHADKDSCKGKDGCKGAAAKAEKDSCKHAKGEKESCKHAKGEKESCKHAKGEKDSCKNKAKEADAK